MPFDLRRARSVAFVATALAVLASEGCSPLVCWRELEVIENDPYEHPVRVSAVLSDQELRLADGRTIRLSRPVIDLESVLMQVDYLVDVEPLREENDGIVRAHVWIRSGGMMPMCGNPWMGLIVIPLKTDTYYRYSLRRLD